LGSRRKQILATDGWLQPSNRRRKHFEVEKSSNVFALHCIAEIYTYIKSVIFEKFTSPRRALAPRPKPPIHTTSQDKARLEIPATRLKRVNRGLVNSTHCMLDGDAAPIAFADTAFNFGRAR
jgi:hypothetical protein